MRGASGLPLTAERVQPPTSTLFAVPPFVPSSSRKDRILNWLSNGLLLLTGLVVLVYVAAFVNPAWVPAPMRPATVEPTFTPLSPTTPSPTDLVLVADTATATATATATPVATLPKSTVTPSFTLTPENTATLTPLPTETDIPTLTPTPTETPTPTLTPTMTPSEFRYTVQSGYPRSMPFPGGCRWMGFSGQVFDLKGQPVIDVVVHIGGVDYLTLSGASQEYNIQGWVQKVADQPASTQGYYTVQLQDTLGNPLSAPVVVHHVQ